MLRVGPRYGWVICASLTLLLAATHGLITSGIMVFDQSLLRDLGIGRGALKFRDLLQLVSGGLFSVVIGFVAMKTGPRAIIYAGLVLLSLVLLAYSRVTSVAQIYPLHVALAFCYASCHVVIVVLIITRWFDARRSVALGIILAGESLGGTIFPQIVVRLVDAFGWRGAMQTLAIMPLFLIVLMLLTLRDTPERFGMARIGAAAPDPDVPVTVTAAPLSFREQLTDGQTLFLFLIAALVFCVGGSYVAHAFLAFLGRGMEAQEAATRLSGLFIAAFAGKLLSGFIAERIGLIRGWIIGQCSLFAGAFLFAFGSIDLLWPATFLLGYGWGSGYTLTQALIMERFAGPWLGRLSGITVLVEGAAAGMGVWLTGVLFDRTGSYDLPFGILVAASAAAIVLSLFLPGLERRRARMALPA